MTSPTIRIILVDDHKLVRDSWKMLLENNPGISVIGAFDNGRDGIEEAVRLNPDIILIDINMSSPLKGFSATEAILRRSSGIKVMGLSVSNQPKFALRMLELGASGYLTKTSGLDEINHGIREVHQGEKYICQEVKAKMNPEEREMF